MSASAGIEPVLQYVARHAGLLTGGSRRVDMEAALLRSVRDADVSLLERDPFVLDAVLTEVTVGETYFFREPQHFEFLRAEFLPERARRGRPVRLWSAACATGEEAYSIAILLDQMGLAGRVVASDLSRNRLDRARIARFSPWSLRGVPPGIVARYFRREESAFRLDPEVRAAVAFQAVNLAAPPFPFADIDVILCRNAFIYLTPPAIRAAATGMADALAEDGCLILGASDPILADIPGLHAHTTPHGIVYRRIAPAAVPAYPVEAPAAPPPPPPPPIHPAPESSADAVERIRSLRGVADAEIAAAAELSRRPACVELRVLRAICLLDLGRYEEAAAEARRAAYLDPGAAMAHFVVAIVHERVGDAGAARRACRHAADAAARLPSGEIVGEGLTAGALAAAARMHLARLEESS